MILAGFEGYHPNSLYRLGRKIVQKYEHQAGDHRKIFRAVGAGETAIAMGLLYLAQNVKSEAVKLNAWATLAKCLGHTKEVVEGVEGIQIVINSSRTLREPKPGQHRPPGVWPGSWPMAITCPSALSWRAWWSYICKNNCRGLAAAPDLLVKIEARWGIRGGIAGKRLATAGWRQPG
jgi:hypothetical protein